jgi:hypothetical protein
MGGNRGAHVSPYYNTLSSRFDTVPSAHITQGGNVVPSNYIGPGTNEYELIRDGYPPMSLSDTCAMIHDIMYALSRNYDDNHNADVTLLENLDIAESLGEPPSNTAQTRNLAYFASISGISVGGRGNSLQKMKDNGTWNERRPVYERVLISARRSGFRIGYLEGFFNKGILDLSTL